MNKLSKRIENILLSYVKNPKTRAVTLSKACEYLTSDGRKCAVGKMLDTKHPQYQQCASSSQSVRGILETYSTNILKPMYRDIPFLVLATMQHFHDSMTVEGVNDGSVMKLVNSLQSQIPDYQFENLVREVENLKKRVENGFTW